MRNVTRMRVTDSVRGKYASSELGLVDSIDYIKYNESFVVYLSSFTIEINKLARPYVDKCVNYAIYHTIDKHDMIHSCITNLTIKNEQKVSTMKLFKSTAINTFFNHTTAFNSSKLKQYMKQCKLRYLDPDCKNSLVSTEVTTEKNVPRGGKKFSFQQMISDKPSFEFNSQSKIEIVDYITYGFGALGTWLGFSFFGCSPVSAIFSTNAVAEVAKKDFLKQTKVQIRQLRNVTNTHRKAICTLIVNVSKKW